ncbi:MAG TPA: hypothetical protein VFB13_17460 [Reyranella sp.]|nr:hypothetical protein [Reyranella sp.]
MIRALAAILLTLIAWPALAQDASLAAWARVYEVLSHPRCANCHVGPDNVPIWFEPGSAAEPRPHGMNINAGPSRVGAETIACSTCHRERNSPSRHGAPGAPNWKLAPVEMQWFGKTSAEICAQLKDPARNGNRALDAVVDHVAHDKLVAWGWAPGPGRAPAPYSAAETAAYLRQWSAAGAPCPRE